MIARAADPGCTGQPTIDFDLIERNASDVSRFV
jgi:hypothetical protein